MLFGAHAVRQPRRAGELIFSNQRPFNRTRGRVGDYPVGISKFEVRMTHKRPTPERLGAFSDGVWTRTMP
jgi:hypothetical protein